MHRLWFSCAACGADNDIEAPAEIFARGLLRDRILPRCRCRRCGYVGASDLRLYWDCGVNALEGARTDKPR